MTRTERDSFGPIEVPAKHHWGAQTQRSLENFPISTEKMPLELIYSLALIKKCAAIVNKDLGKLDVEKSQAIQEVAQDIIDGKYDNEFPLSIWQTGSGTQTNMNLNEVIANLASEKLGSHEGVSRSVHPNDHVNMAQSSNDVFPTAMHIACAKVLTNNVLPACQALRDALFYKSEEFSGIIKIGRTHLQDATPLTLGQEFSGYVEQLDIAMEAITDSLPRLYQLAIGGTAVGTGLNAHPEFTYRICQEIEHETLLPFRSAPNKFQALAGHEAVVTAHGALKTLAAALFKIANDIRYLASGPRSGLGELIIPENEPGSSIMPGKVNPTQCEALTMACIRVFGNDTAVGFAGASGAFELNVYKPVIIDAFMQSARLLADSMDSFRIRCVDGIVPNTANIERLLQRSLMLATALCPHIGYDAASKIALRASHEGLSLKESALLSGISEADYNAWVVPEDMLGPSA